MSDIKLVMPENAQRHDNAMMTALTRKGAEFLALMDTNHDVSLALTMGSIDSVERPALIAVDLARFAEQRGLTVEVGK